MGTPGDYGLPFADHAPEAFVDGEGGQFSGGEPAEVAALLAEDGGGGLGGDEHEADIGCNRVFVLLKGDTRVVCPGHHESRRRGANQIQGL